MSKRAIVSIYTCTLSYSSEPSKATVTFEASRRSQQWRVVIRFVMLRGDESVAARSGALEKMPNISLFWAMSEAIQRRGALFNLWRSDSWSGVRSGAFATAYM